MADEMRERASWWITGFLAASDEERLELVTELLAARVELERRTSAGAETLADQTLLRGLTVENGGINLDLIPPREIAAVWVHCAIGMLGDAPNYTETEVKMPSVSMEISPAGSYDRYALIVQRVGKLTPREARQKAERERDEWRERAEKAEAANARVRALADRLAREEHPSHDHLCPDDIRRELLAALDGQETG